MLEMSASGKGVAGTRRDVGREGEGTSIEEKLKTLNLRSDYERDLYSISLASSSPVQSNAEIGSAHSGSAGTIVTSSEYSARIGTPAAVYEPLISLGPEPVPRAQLPPGEPSHGSAKPVVGEPRSDSNTEASDKGGHNPMPSRGTRSSMSSSGKAMSEIPSFPYNTSSFPRTRPAVMDPHPIASPSTPIPVSRAPPKATLSKAPLKSRDNPLASAYHQTIKSPSARTTVPDSLVYPHPTDEFQTALMQSWKGTGIHSDPARQAQLRAFIDRLNTIINRAFDSKPGGSRSPKSRYRVEPFGSVSWDGTTGFGDLDLVVLDSKLPRGYEPKVWRQLPGMPAPPPLPDKAKGRARNHYIHPNVKVPSLYNTDRLANCLRQAGMQSVQSIKWASVPIVKFVEPTYGWQCDINVNELGGWFNSQLILAYCNVNPTLVRPLIHTLKMWAANRCINDPAGANGLITLSSYALTIMAIAYLQIRGCLPNLQACSAADIEALGGEKHNVVFVDWQNDQGTPIVCCFNRSPPVGWESAEPSLTAADAIRGFFEYFSTTGPVEHHLGRFDYANQALSVLHGGLLNRVKERRTAVPGMTPQEERVLVGDAGRGVQPRVWFDNRMVIQDPFIYMKSIARSVNKNGFNAIIQEIDRAHAKLAAQGRDVFWFLCEDPYR